MTSFDSSSLVERVEALRNHPLPKEWVAKVISGDEDAVVSDDLPSGQWVTLMFVVAFKKGSLSLTEDEVPASVAERISETVTYLEETYPGLVDAPAVVRRALELFDFQEIEADAGGSSSDQFMSEAEDTPEDTAWYGISRVASALMMLISNEGDAYPALQLRLFDGTKKEFLNRMMPFGDVLFLATSLIGNIGDSLKSPHLSIEQGKISNAQRMQLIEQTALAQAQISRLQGLLNSPLG